MINYSIINDFFTVGKNLRYILNFDIAEVRKQEEWKEKKIILFFYFAITLWRKKKNLLPIFCLFDLVDFLTIITQTYY